MTTWVKILIIIIIIIKFETLIPTRPVENVVLTKKGLQERNTQMLDEATVEK